MAVRPAPIPSGVARPAAAPQATHLDGPLNLVNRRYTTLPDSTTACRIALRTRLSGSWFAKAFWTPIWGGTGHTPALAIQRSTALETQFTPRAAAFERTRLVHD